MEVWGCGKWEQQRGPNHVASSDSKAKITLLDFTASKQNAVQHLGQEQPPVRRDEHLPHHIHRQPEPADGGLKTGL